MIKINETTKYDEIGMVRVTTIKVTINGNEYSTIFSGYGNYSADFKMTYNSLEDFNSDAIDYNSEFGQALRRILSRTEYADSFGIDQELETLEIWQD